MTAARPRKEGGFSLVEVVLAIGIVVFCLLAIVGLFSVGQTASRRATDQTSLAAAAFQVMSKTRSLPNPTATTYYFNRQGQATNLASANYVCDVSLGTVPTTEMADISTNLTRVKMQFTWPASIASNRPYTNIFYATLSRP